MIPHPEGGHYAESYRAPSAEGARSAVTAIYFLLRLGERSHWHRVDATEIWLWHAGAPLALSIGAKRQILGPDLSRGQRPQAVVARDVWQSAEALGAWSLVSCVVAPGFEFAGFELAAADFEP
jgi:predicted cupin superfamily sugar epimerase